MTFIDFLKVMIISFFSLNIASAHIDVRENWNSSYKKEVVITCSEDETFCDSVCGKTNQCVIPEAPCTNCIGSTLIMTFYFQEMGRLVQNNTEEVNFYDVTSLILQRGFVSLSSKSIYNHIDNFNSLSLQRKFRAMCNDGTRHPVVFFNKLDNNEIGRPEFVWCESGFYAVEINSNIDLDSDYGNMIEKYLY